MFGWDVIMSKCVNAAYSKSLMIRHKNKINVWMGRNAHKMCELSKSLIIRHKHEINVWMGSNAHKMYECRKSDDRTQERSKCLVGM